eukprot:TRINITY_DN4350_c0_g3_i3.p1 TRINITY_DN4350_c0_g3~~TRINITY_DN4350_c0_g3_i3.p1  ORF type:complete len:128 (-),score=30.28 TRINITY_DN4350_c0_g3_i3:172-555(-)
MLFSEDECWKPFGEGIDQLSAGKDGHIWGITTEGKLTQSHIEIPQWTLVDDFKPNLKFVYVCVHKKDTILVQVSAGNMLKKVGDRKWLEMPHFHKEHAKQVVVAGANYKVFFGIDSFNTFWGADDEV